MILRHLHHPATNRLALLAGISALVVATYSASFLSMWDLWQTSDHRHGILVFPLAAFLVWRARHSLSDVPIRVEARGLLLILPIALLWAVARLAGVQVIEHAAVLAMIPAAVVTLMGAGIARRLLFPLLFLFLAIPVGDALIPLLMIVTADISTALLKISGIPVLREGQYLSLPGGNFVVADVCSGVRYLITGTMIALLYGYLTYSSPLKRVILVAITGVALVIANGVRAYIVMAVASATNMQYLGGRDHIYFGWLLFGIVMMLVMWIGARYADQVDEPRGPDPSDTIVARASHSALPIIAALGLIMLAITVKPLQADFGESGAMLAAAAALLVFIGLLVRGGAGGKAARAKTTTSTAGFRASSLLTTTAAVGILLLTPRLVAAAERAAPTSLDAASLRPHIGCVEAGQWSGRWQPLFRQPDVEYALAFDCGGQPVNVYTAAYANALQGRELISSSHHPVPPDWERHSTTGRYPVVDASGTPRVVMEVHTNRDGSETLVWYWYEVDGTVAASPLRTKMLQVLALVSRRASGGRVVVVETPVQIGAPQSRERLEHAARSLMPSADRELPRESS